MNKEIHDMHGCCPDCIYRNELDYVHCKLCKYGKTSPDGRDFFEKESCINCLYDASTPHTECTGCTHNQGFYYNWVHKENKFAELCKRIKNKYKKD